MRSAFDRDLSRNPIPIGMSDAVFSQQPMHVTSQKPSARRCTTGSWPRLQRRFVKLHVASDRERRASVGQAAECPLSHGDIRAQQILLSAQRSRSTHRRTPVFRLS